MKLASVLSWGAGLVAALWCGAIVLAAETPLILTPPAGRPTADQRADRFGAAGLAFPLYHSHHRRAADRVQRRGAAGRSDRQRGHRAHSRHVEDRRRLQGRPAGQECPRRGPEGVSHRHRRADLPDAAAGLEQLELLGRGRRSRQSAAFRPGHGQVGPDRSRLDLHQHRRHLAGPPRRRIQRASRGTRNSPT